MGLSNHWTVMMVAVSCAITLTGCNDASVNSSTQTSSGNGIDLSMFAQGAFLETPTIIDCETAQGTKTRCYKLVTSGAPAGREPGPFCPRKITDGAEEGGAWFSKEGTGDLVDITGEFILKLSEYYGDEKWMVYDAATGDVRYTATKEACFGAAKPDVEEEYMQNCIECKLEYLDEDFSVTYLIPTQPIPSTETGRVHTVGIALDGSELSGPAPIDAILGAYTIAAFDDCGGHINAHQGYHYHSTTGCTDTPEKTDDGHAPLIGYASDGYGIYAMRDAQGKEAEPLDECRGQSDDVRGYHYHAASPSENMFIGCLHGESIRPAGGPPGGAGGPPNGPPPHGK
ncbi:YHYH protein [Aliiglaciecola sp. 3_MG-2023]|uniref:YHYH protein n=1 Tax=Aliiglaciecola sp. 3_MG-2023 TaxID=3062644 RepID=UPI0026E1BA32|nr:YHYH protein [Aliiglaciecola sp. 3_MG-2023]MDO6695213.1 YHYH protein [Aliiglaciecola sp. 3_MG-2023]